MSLFELPLNNFHYLFIWREKEKEKEQEHFFTEDTRLYFIKLKSSIVKSREIFTLKKGLKDF